MTDPVQHCPNCGNAGDSLHVFEDTRDGLTVSRFTCHDCNKTGEAHIA